MIVFRLSKGQYKDTLDGRGAEMAGGRWNSKGRAMVYTGESRALCTTELAVHIPLGILPTDYHMATIEVPDTINIYEVSLQSLPVDWKLFPHSRATRAIGDRFLSEEKYLGLKVPSAVVQGDHNYLLNPMHPEFSQVKILQTEPFNFDQRLFRR